MANDWCGKTTWSEADQADFFAHLKRSRTDYHKTQYLRIQAHCLEKVGSLEFLQAAIKLLDKILTEFSEGEFPERAWLATAYSQKASCLLKLGDVDNAIVNYQRALATEREFRTLKTNAFIDFGKLVAEKKLTHLFDEALIALEAELNSRGMHVPSEIFYAFGIRSIIAAHRGQTEKAEEFAKVALEAAAKDHSGLRYHPTAGLVGDKETTFYKSVAAIAES